MSCTGPPSGSVPADVLVSALEVSETVDGVVSLVTVTVTGGASLADAGVLAADRVPVLVTGAVEESSGGADRLLRTIRMPTTTSNATTAAAASPPSSAVRRRAV